MNTRILIILALLYPVPATSGTVILMNSAESSKSAPSPYDLLPVTAGAACKTAAGKAGRTTGGMHNKCVDD
jgi:hypothetical protein